jgi:hypothetical protein
MNVPVSAYVKSKTLAERAAWDFIRDLPGLSTSLFIEKKIEQKIEQKIEKKNEQKNRTKIEQKSSRPLVTLGIRSEQR